MGTANKIPGVSGGVVALALNFYDEFIDSIKKINIHKLLIFKFKDAFKNSNTSLLIYISVGIVISYYHINIISHGNVNEIIKYNFIKPLQYFGIGFIIYTTKMPERIISQYFDIYGSSHQLWHIFSFMGSYYYHEEIIKNINYRLIDNCYYCFNNASAMAALTSNCVI